ELRLPNHLERLADIVAAGETQRAYAGCATIESTGVSRYFLLMAGIGLDAAIAGHLPPPLKKRGGKAAFWYSGLGHLVRWKPRPFHVEVDGERHTATFAAFGRVSRYGGNLLITPRARLDQPEFEICLVHSINRLRYLRLLPAAMFGGLSETMKEVSFFRA